MSSVCFVTSSEHSITSNILQYTPLVLCRDTPLVLVFLYGTPLVLLYDSLPLLGKLYRLFIKSIEQALFLSPWAFNFFNFAVNFNSGFTTKLQNKKQCFHFCAMGKGLHNMIR